MMKKKLLLISIVTILFMIPINSQGNECQIIEAAWALDGELLEDFFEQLGMKDADKPSMIEGSSSKWVCCGVNSSSLKAI